MNIKMNDATGNIRRHGQDSNRFPLSPQPISFAALPLIESTWAQYFSDESDRLNENKLRWLRVQI
jgi:hypothetical protein